MVEQWGRVVGCGTRVCGTRGVWYQGCVVPGACGTRGVWYQGRVVPGACGSVVVGAWARGGVCDSGGVG